MRVIHLDEITGDMADPSGQLLEIVAHTGFKVDAGFETGAKLRHLCENKNSIIKRKEHQYVRNLL